MADARAVMRPAFTGPLSGSRSFVDFVSSFFGPQRPIAPQAPPGTPPRVDDYSVGINMNYQPRGEEEVTFAQLRDLARVLDLVAMAIETRKDQIASIRWSIKPIKIEGETKAEFKSRAESVTGVNRLMDRFARPDGQTIWHAWIRMLVHEILVIDAACILPFKAQGEPALSLINGATIKVLVDAQGRTPFPPTPAYQQILKGLPAIDLTTADLYYYQRSPRVDHLYGYSPVEQIISTINMALRRTMYKLAYYTEGNLPEAIIQLPENWPIQKIQQFSDWWNSILSGQVDQRRKAFFVPSIGGDNAISYPKEATIKDEMDEWIARVVCYAFSLPVQPFIREMNRATATTARDAALTEGLQPLMDYLKAIFDDIIHLALGRPDLEWAWQEDDEPDLLKRAQIQDIQIKAMVKAPNECRADNGDDAVPGGELPGFQTAQGFIALGERLEPPDPVGGKKPGENGNGNGNGKKEKGDAMEKVRHVRPADAFHGERAKRILITSTRLVTRFLARQGQASAQALAAAYSNTHLPPASTSEE